MFLRGHLKNWDTGWLKKRRSHINAGIGMFTIYASRYHSMVSTWALAPNFFQVGVRASNKCGWANRFPRSKFTGALNQKIPLHCQNSFHRCRRKDRRVIVRAAVVSQVARFAQISSSAHVGALGKMVLFTCLLQGFLDVFCRPLSHTLEVSRLWRQAKAACDSPRSTVPRGK